MRVSSENREKTLQPTICYSARYVAQIVEHVARETPWLYYALLGNQNWFYLNRDKSLIAGSSRYWES